MNKNIVLFSTFDWGGAAESIIRIARALRELGHNTVVIVKQKTKNEDFIIQAQETIVPVPTLAKRVKFKVKTKVYNEIAKLGGVQKKEHPELITDYNFAFGNRNENISSYNTESLVSQIPFKPDLIIVGWITFFINTQNMRELDELTKAPIYCLTTDMEPFTGGCHYAWDCTGYTNDCANCPAILTEELKQTAKDNLKIKIDNLCYSNVRVLAGSEWCRSQAQKSTLFRHQESIPVLNGVIDQNVFNNQCRDFAKKVFGVNNNEKLIFTGSTFTSDKRKGIEYLVEALKELYFELALQERISLKILIAGQHVLENEFVKNIPFEVVAIDFIKDDRLLSLAYQAADLFVCSSIEDSGPMMVNEALACGTPVIGFDLGFVSDIVEHGKNGFRVPLKNTQLMANYMQKILSLSVLEAEDFSCRAIEAINKKVSKNRLAELIDEISN